MKYAERKCVVMYKFKETIADHSNRISDTLNRTRLLRRALLNQLDGGARFVYKNMAKMTVAELRKDLGVIIALSGVIRPDPEFKPAVIDTALAMLRQDHYSHTDESKRHARTRIREVEGYVLTPSQLVHGYVLDQHRCIPLPEWVGVMEYAIQVAVDDGYSAAGRYMNEQGFFTARGRDWNKDTSRDWLMNPFLAGYKREGNDNSIYKRSGGLNIRGPLNLDCGFDIEPIMTIDEWIVINANYVRNYGHLFMFPSGYRNPYDEQAINRL